MTGLARTPLTLLYAPADRPDLVRKAIAGSADVVSIDLEDAVAPAHKPAARAGLADLIRGADRPIRVRINAVDTPWHADDVAAVVALPADIGVIVPKAERPDLVAQLAAALPGRALHLLLESALGVEAASALARVAGVATIGLGEADLRADLGCEEPGLAYARGRVVVAARAAGLPAPVMSVHPDIRDLDGLAASCRAGRALGFLGRSAIHPGQLAVIRDAFAPTDDEVSRARATLERFDAAQRDGRGALAMPDGSFVDEAVIRRARVIAGLAG